LRIELARAGNWNGQVLTKEHLEQVVKNFKDEVPVVLGHLKADHMPAFGWIKEVELSPDGTTLYGEVELSDVLKEAYDFGLYKKWSVGLRKNDRGEWYLHHLAFLGAVPPRIKGLKVLEMSDLEGIESFEFSEKPKWKSFAKTDWPVAGPETPWDGEEAKKRIVEKFGWEKLKRCVGAVDVSEEETPEAYSKYKFPFCDVVDGQVKIVPKAVSAGLAYLNGARGVKVDESLARVVRPVLEKLKERIEKAKKNFSDGGFDMPTIEELQKQIAELQEKLKQAEEKAEFADSLKAELETYRKALKEQKKEELKKAMEGKVPADKVKLALEFADKVEIADKKLEFSDEKKRDLFDVLTEIFSSLPELPLNGEVNFGDPVKDDVDLTQVMLEKL
jgi:hypothetical protein